MASIGSSGEQGRSRSAWIGATVFSLLACVIQATTTANLKLGLRSAGFSREGTMDRLDLLKIVVAALTPLDWVLLGAAAIAGLWLVMLEIRYRAVSGIVRSAVGRRGCAWALLLLVVVLSCRAYLDAGIPDAYDAKMHFAKTSLVVETLEAGAYPAFTMRWYAGYPVLRFYGPASYLLSALLAIPTGSTTGGIRLMLLLSHALSVIFCYLWLRSLLRSRAGALLGAAAYALSFLRLYAVLTLGRSPVAPMHVGFLLSLLAIERFVRSGCGWRWGAAAALGIGIMVLSHPGLGRHGLVTLALYGAVRLLFHRPWPRLRQLASFIVVGALGSMLLAGGWVLEATRHQPDAMLRNFWQPGLPSFIPSNFKPAGLLDLLRWGFGPDHPSGVAYLGWSVMLLVGIGLIRGFRHRWREVVSLTVLAVFLLPLVGGSYLERRAVQFLVPVVCGLAAFSLLGRSRNFRWLPLAFLLIAIDLLPLTLLSPFRPDLVPLRSALKECASEDPDGRFVLLSERHGKLRVSQWPCGYDSGLKLVSGPHMWGAGDSYPFLMAAIDMAYRELRVGELSPAGRTVLHRMGISGILVEDGVTVRRIPVVAPGSTSLAHLYAHAAVGVSPRETEGSPMFEPGSDAAAPWRRRLIRLTVLEGDQSLRLASPPPDAGGAPSGPPGQICSVRIEDEQAVVDVQADTPAWLSLRFSWFPDLSATVNGETVPVIEDSFGLSAIRVPSGRHSVVLRGPHPPWTSLTLAVIALIGLIATVIVPGRRRAPTGA